MRWEGGKDMHTHMRTQHNIQHSAFSIQHSAQEGFIIIQHPAFSIQRRRHSSSFSIQHSAQEGCTIQRRRLHHSAMKIACVGNTTPAPPPRTTKENVCVGNTTQEGFIIIQHSAQEAFSAGPGVLGTHTEQLYQRVARDVRDVHAVVLDSTARPRLLDLQLRQPSLRVMRPWGLADPSESVSHGSEFMDRVCVSLF
jgi:hypothetical protein